MAEFSIRVESVDPPRGRIRIGDLAELFELNCSLWSCSEYRRDWAKKLEQLLGGVRSVVVLWTWRCPAPSVGIQRGWVGFAEDSQVIFQEWIFVPGEHDAHFDGDGIISEQVHREEVDEDGNPISQWETTMDAIEAFLRHDGAS